MGSYEYNVKFEVHVGWLVDFLVSPVVGGETPVDAKLKELWIGSPLPGIFHLEYS